MPTKTMNRWLLAVVLVLMMNVGWGCSESGETAVGAQRSQALFAEWREGTSYGVGDVVAFGGRQWRVLQAHTSIAGWQPPNVPSLFEDRGRIAGEAEGPAVFPASCEDDPVSCCPEGSVPIVLTSGADTHQITTEGRCVIALEGNDSLQVLSSKPSAIFGGPGEDVIYGGMKSDLLVGGPGRDILYGAGGSDELYGGADDDVIFSGNGGSRVYPGPGLDRVTTGDGDDTIIIFDLCEVEAGEELDAGEGEDTLISPVPESELLALGVILKNIEHVVVERNSCRSECVQQPLCGRGEICVNGAEPGQAICQAREPSSASDFRELKVYLPRGERLEDVGLGARRELGLAAGANAELGNQRLTVAQGGAMLGEGARASTLVARDGATLRESSVIVGDLRSTAPSVLPTGAVVTGQVSASEELSPPEVFTFSQVFPPPSEGDLLLQSGRSRIVWPGDYGSLIVEGGAQVYLKSGRYRFQSLRLESGSQMYVESSEGTVFVDVALGLAARGTVQGLGTEKFDLVVVYGGREPVELSGAFRGALFAPEANLHFEAGRYAGFFYGNRVAVEAAATFTAIQRSWLDVFPPSTPPDVALPAAPPGAGLRASTNQPATYSRPGGFELRIREALVVEAGNAGNHAATLTFTAGGATHSCTYRGGSTVAHPTTLLEKARGRQYHFESCTDGAQPGDVRHVDSVRLDVEGDALAPGGVTRLENPVDGSCRGDLSPPLSPGRSRELIESFEWPLLTVPTEEPLIVNGRVMERTNDGKPALYYAQIYITNQRELELLDQFLIHWSKRPLFLEEWPQDWKGGCGTIHYTHDGEGLWVYAVLPGVTYNAIRRARTNEDIEESQRETFRAVRLIQPPASAEGEFGTLRTDVLAENGFKYLGIRGMPDEAALRAALYRAGVVSTLVDVVEFVVDAVRDVVREVVILFGTLDSMWGTVTLHIDTTVMHDDPRFARTDDDGLAIPMYSAWNTFKTKEIAATGARVTLHNVVMRPTTLWVPVPVQFTGQMNGAGQVKLEVSRDDDSGRVEFWQLCYELQNDAGTVTTFLIADEVCDGRPSREDFGQFRADGHRLRVDTDSNSLRLHAELTDSYEYLREIVGKKAKKAKLLHGGAAWHLSGFKDTAFAGCFGYGNAAIDTAITSLGVLGVPSPIGILPLGYLTALADADIVITDGSIVHQWRGVTAHEYGHFALCTLVNESGENFLAKAMLTFDTIVAGSDPDLGDDARIVNEAFADFYAGQVAGAYNYFSVRGESDLYLGDKPATSIFVKDPGADDNLRQENNGWNAIGRLATLIQDVFDGHASRAHAPNDGDYWREIEKLADGTPVKFIVRGSSASSYGDGDLETVSLGGGRITTLVQEFMAQRPGVGSYTIDALERGVGKLLTDRVSWCDACRVMAPHFEGAENYSDYPNYSRSDARQMLFDCAESSRLRGALGSPPVDLRQLDAWTCEPCPPGQGMKEDGRCGPCTTEVTLDWGSRSRACYTWNFAGSSSEFDFCPETLTIDVTNAGGEYPLQEIFLGVSDVGSWPECHQVPLSAQVTRLSPSPASLLDLSVAGGAWSCPIPLLLPVGHCLFPDGERKVCPAEGGLCTSECLWGGNGVQQVSVEGDSFRIQINAGTKVPWVTLQADRTRCGPR